MININLLPDIKQQYLQSQKAKRLFIIGSLLVTAVFVSVTLLVGAWTGAQRLHLQRLQSDIDQASQQLEQQTDLAKIVTVQNQLNALPPLHDSKLALHRLSGYLGKVVPTNVRMTSLLLGSGDSGTSMEIHGQTVDAKSVNVFADTLKNATYTYGSDKTQIVPFTNVQVTSIAIATNSEEGGDTSFVITLNYDPLIFDNTHDEFELKVPNITSSPSVTERPGDLFAEPEEGGQ